MARLLICALALALMCHSAPAAAQFPLERLAEGGYVVMLRHALAPGVGDPANFRLDDCATQRNLSADGRAQARRLGERLRAHGIEQAEIYSSQWCRCLDTAALLDLGQVQELPALNSFFSRPDGRERNLEALRAFLAGLPEDGPPVILVTHQVTISAIAGGGTASGEAVVLKADGTGQPPVVGRIEPQWRVPLTFPHRGATGSGAAVLGPDVRYQRHGCGAAARAVPLAGSEGSRPIRGQAG